MLASLPLNSKTLERRSIEKEDHMSIEEEHRAVYI